MANGLEIILGDAQVKSVFVNVFGGITACDAVANGIVQAFELLDSRGEPVDQAARRPARRQQRRARPRRSSTEAGLAGLEQVDTMDGAADRAAELASRRLSRRAQRHRSTRMSIFLNADSKVIVQGMTGLRGPQAHPADAGLGHQDRRRGDPRQGRPDRRVRRRRSVPVFGSVGEAVEATGADVTVIFVPAKFTKGAVVEAVEAEIPLAVVITEGVPVQDTAEFFACRRARTTRLIGPNCPGLISPGQSNAGIIPADITPAGRIGLVSKSGTLTYQMMYELRDIGFSSAVGIGGDPVIGTTHIDALAAFQADPDTDAIVMIGEIGGDAEERAAEYIKANVTKPVVGYVAGLHRARGQDDGPRRRDRLRRVRHRGGASRRPWRPPGSRSARPRARPRSSCARSSSAL